MSELYNPQSQNNIQIRAGTAVIDEVTHTGTLVTDDGIIANQAYIDRIYTYDSFGEMVHLAAGTGIPSNLHIGKLVVDSDELVNTDTITTIDEHGISVASSTGSIVLNSDRITVTNAANESFYIDPESIEYIDAFNTISEILPSQIKFNKDVASDVTTINTLHDNAILLEGALNDTNEDIIEINTRIGDTTGSSVKLGSGYKLGLANTGYFGSWTGTKEITVCTGSGIYIDHSNTVNTAVRLADTIYIGSNVRASGSPARSVAIGRDVEGVSDGVCIGAGISTGNGTTDDTHYSICMGTNISTVCRSFCFGRDIALTAPTASGFSMPSLIMGSTITARTPKGKATLIGAYISSSLDEYQNPDGMSNCIVLGGSDSALPIMANSMHLGGDRITAGVFLYGLGTSGNNINYNPTTKQLTSSKGITLTSNGGGATKEFNYDKLVSLEANSLIPFRTLNNVPDIDRKTVVYNSRTNTFSHSALPIIVDASMVVHETITWNNITALPLTTAKDRPKFCGAYGRSIYFHGDFAAATYNFATNSTYYFTFCVNANASLTANRIPGYKLSSHTNAECYTTAGKFIKYNASISEPIKCVDIFTGTNAYYMYVISVQNLDTVPINPKMINFSVEPTLTGYFTDNGDSVAISAATFTNYK